MLGCSGKVYFFTFILRMKSFKIFAKFIWRVSD